MINISKRPPILRGGWGLKSALLYFEPEIPHWVQLLRIEVGEIKKTRQRFADGLSSLLACSLTWFD